MPNGTYNGYTWEWYDEAGLPQEDEPAVHECTFPDTGLLRSWCRDCGAVAEFNMETGTYRRVADGATDSKSK